MMRAIVIEVLEWAKTIRDIESAGFHVRRRMSNDSKMNLQYSIIYSIYIRMITKLERLNWQLIRWTPIDVIGFAFPKQLHKIQLCPCSSERSTSDDQG